MTPHDDRFGDLGAGGPPADDRTAAERLEELDEREPEPQPEKPPPPRPSSRYSWVVGIAFLLAIMVAGLNAINTEGPGVGLEPGEEAPLFVAPLASTGLDRDANAEGVCAIDLPDTVNLCRLRGGRVVLTFFFTRFADCVPQLDRVEQAQRLSPDVRFVGVLVREDKGDAQKLLREQGWTFPVALDRDGLVSNLYGVAGCPTTVFIDAAGDVVDTRNGELGVQELVRGVR